jgi:hypothetical protein
MLLQVKEKKGVSELIGYIILITIALVMGAIIFVWIKSYVPTASLSCQDGVSISVRSFQYDCKRSLNITIKNTGRFSITGYYIHATNKSGQELATIDLSNYLNQTLSSPSIILNSWISFYGTADNSLPPDNQITESFYLPMTGGKLTYGNLTSIEIIAARYETLDNKNKFVTCTGSRITQDFTC